MHPGSILLLKGNRRIITKNKTMNFLALLKKTEGIKDRWGVARKWVIYYDKDHKIKEIKSLFLPNDYKGARPSYTDKELIQVLTNQS
jgi:hypothetical protein